MAPVLGRRMPHKIAFVLIDGIGDISVPELGNLTPLETADTVALDAVAAAGINGLLDPVEPGLACGSDTAHLSIFGYDPRLYYRGRGAFESMGAGIPMQPGDIAFKSNFATIDEKSGIVVRRRADRRFEDMGPILCAALDGLRLSGHPQHSVRVQYATEHRCGVVVSGPGLSDCISGTDPLRDNLPLMSARPLDASVEAKRTAAIVNELSDEFRKVLRDHPVNEQRRAEGKVPANLVLLRGCGSRIAVQPFQSRYGLRACMVAPTKIIAGLGMSLHMEVLSVAGATGDYKSQFHAKAEAIAGALVKGRYELGFLHVKAVDDTGHDRALAMKVRYFEVVDQMVLQLIKRLWIAEKSGDSQFSILVTGDHSTPVLFGDHSHEPVPLGLAHVRDIVEALGGDERMESVSFKRIPHPDPPEAQPPLQVLTQQAMKRRHAVAMLPCATRGDCVDMFDELSAAAGCLGRFPGSQLMRLICQICSN